MLKSPVRTRFSFVETFIFHFDIFFFFFENSFQVSFKNCKIFIGWSINQTQGCIFSFLIKYLLRKRFGNFTNCGKIIIALLKTEWISYKCNWPPPSSLWFGDSDLMNNGIPIQLKKRIFVDIHAICWSFWQTYSAELKT